MDLASAKDSGNLRIAGPTRYPSPPLHKKSEFRTGSSYVITDEHSQSYSNSITGIIYGFIETTMVTSHVKR